MNLKSKVNQSDFDKLVPVPVDLKKLSEVLEKEIAQKTVSGKLVKNVNVIYTSGFVNTNLDTRFWGLF